MSGIQQLAKDLALLFKTFGLRKPPRNHFVKHSIRSLFLFVRPNQFVRPCFAHILSLSKIESNLPSFTRTTNDIQFSRSRNGKEISIRLMDNEGKILAFIVNDVFHSSSFHFNLTIPILLLVKRAFPRNSIPHYLHLDKYGLHTENTQEYILQPLPNARMNY